MIRKILLLFILVFTVYQALGQFGLVSREIAWMQNRVFYNPYQKDELSKTKWLFYFENAVYKHEISDLPFFSELLPPGGEQDELLLEEMVFESFRPEELKDVSGLNSIKENMEVSQKAVYIKKRAYLEISFVPIRKNAQTGQIEKLVRFTIAFSKKGKSTTKKLKQNKYTSNSVLSSGTWVKIKIDKSGIYKLNFSDLQQLGIQNPVKARIFGNGGKMLSYLNDGSAIDDLKEIKVMISDNAVYFYGQGPVVWKRDPVSGFFGHQKRLYTDYAWYFISSDYDPLTNNLVQTEEQSASPETHDVNTFTAYEYHEIDSANLIGSGRLGLVKNLILSPNIITGLPFLGYLTIVLLHSKPHCWQGHLC